MGLRTFQNGDMKSSPDEGEGTGKIRIKNDSFSLTLQKYCYIPPEIFVRPPPPPRITLLTVCFESYPGCWQ